MSWVTKFLGIGLLAVVATLVWPGGNGSGSACAYADSPADAPSAADRKRARKIVRKALKEKARGERFFKKKGKRNRRRAMRAYHKAALGLIEAINLVDKPALVFQLARVYQARGELRWALRGFRRYVELDADGRGNPDRLARAKQLAEELAAQIAERETAGKSFAEDDASELEPTAIFGVEKTPSSRSDEPSTGQDATAAKESASRDTDEPAVPAPEKSIQEKQPQSSSWEMSRGKWMRWGGIGGAGLGLVFLSVGVGFGLSASSAADKLSNNDDAWNQNDKSLIAQGESDSSRAALFMTVGLVTAAASGALYYVGTRQHRRDRASVSKPVSVVPQIGAREIGVRVTGSF